MKAKVYKLKVYSNMDYDGRSYQTIIELYVPSYGISLNQANSELHAFKLNAKDRKSRYAKATLVGETRVPNDIMEAAKALIESTTKVNKFNIHKHLMKQGLVTQQEINE